jgi:hypothetical protein
LPLSAVDCVQPALKHARAQLFTHFRWGQWSRLALVGILAAELHVGGCGFPNLRGGWPHVPHGRGDIMQSSMPHGLGPLNPAHISEHLAQFLGLMVAAIFAFFVLGFLFLYISSVFRFILFDSVLRRECSIGAGWGKWRRAGGRFFLWQIVFQIAVSLCLLVLVGVPLALALAAGWTRDLRAHAAPLIFGGILVLGLVLLFVLASVAVQVLAKDFLVPIMALEDLDFADGWHRLLAIMRPEKGSYAVYLLLKLVLSVAAGILFTMIAVVPVLVVVVSVVAAGLAGHAAGIGWSLMTISLAIISATVLLFLLLYLIALVCVPATVFVPAYAMYFLASRYPNLDAILNPRPDPILPPVPESAPPLPDPPASFEPPPSSPSPEPIG